MKKNYTILAVLLIVVFTSCKKDGVVTNPAGQSIRFSIDTLRFDTVFTQRGSVTQSFKIVNTSKRDLKLGGISLSGGSQSPFKLNINGVNAAEVGETNLRGDDSLYVFVQVFVDPNNQTQPFILEDSVAVKNGANTQWLQLRAYGQNAIYLKNKEITSDTSWDNHLPIVIDGYAHVASGVKLTIGEGTKVYLHATAPFLIDGTLDAVGSVSQPIIFDGDRLDPDYKNLPASWPGIYFSPSSEQNLLQSVIIQNAYQGVIADQMTNSPNPKVHISRSVIQNIYDAGIQAVHSSLLIENSLIANCGKNLDFMLGGNYTMVNCTVASYDNRYFGHANPVLSLTNSFSDGTNSFTADLNAQFTNCIFWGQEGNVKNEISAEKDGSGVYHVVMTHCLYRAEDAVANVTFNQSFLNEDPLFDSINPRRNIYDFHVNINPQSPALNSGIPTIYNVDLDGKTLKNPPDLGCYRAN